MAYYEMEPFGESRGDLRSAQIAALLANIHRRRGRKAFSVEDFMPKFGPDAKPEQTAEEIAKGLMAWAREQREAQKKARK